ncbi:MAG TPA: nickel-binding protein [Polyangiaceae bacterium]
MEHVIVERVFADPVQAADVYAAMQKAPSCLDAHRVRHLRSCLSLDGLRMICEYEAPDAESVRTANLRMGSQFERIWTAKVLSPSDPAR